MLRDQFSRLSCSMWCVAMCVFCSAGGANSAGQTRETYDPTYCSVKLPEPQPLAPMDAETVERYVGASNYWAISSSLSSSFMYFSTVVGHYVRKSFLLFSLHSPYSYICLQTIPCFSCLPLFWVALCSLPSRVFLIHVWTFLWMLLSIWVFSSWYLQ